MEQTANQVNECDLKDRLIRHPDYVRGLRDLVKRPAIQVALTGQCNFNCVYCSTRFQKKKRQIMSMDLVNRIIDDCKEWNINPWFGQTYEPFLHKHIAEIISRVNSSGLFFISSTNGSCLSPSVYDLPMDLTISVSENEKDYAFRGSTIPFERYKKGLKSFIENRIKQNIPGTMTFQFADYYLLETGDRVYDKKIVSVNAIATKMKRFADYLGLAWEIGPDELTSSIKNRYLIPVYNNGGPCIRFVSTRITPSIAVPHDAMEPETDFSGYCDSCYHIMSIQADGGVAVCCCDPQANTVFHHLSPDDRLKHVWEGEKIMKIRESFSGQKPFFHFCRTCLQPVSSHIKPLLTCFRRDIVSGILNEFGVDSDLPWFEFGPSTDK